MSANQGVTLFEQLQRRRRVFELRERGYGPSEIGWRVGLKPESVRKVLREAGVARGHLPEHLGNQVDGIWSLDEDQRKIEITRRAARAATATLLERLDG